MAPPVAQKITTHRVDAEGDASAEETPHHDAESLEKVRHRDEMLDDGESQALLAKYGSVNTSGHGRRASPLVPSPLAPLLHDVGEKDQVEVDGAGEVTKHES